MLSPLLKLVPRKKEEDESPIYQRSINSISSRNIDDTDQLNFFTLYNTEEQTDMDTNYHSML